MHAEYTDPMDDAERRDEGEPSSPGAARWADLRAVRWRRKKWRPGSETSEDRRCVACGLVLHPAGSYYLRPAYWDGDRWMCVRCHHEMMHAEGQPSDNRYGRRL